MVCGDIARLGAVRNASVGIEPEKVVHRLAEIIRFRMLMIAAGYEDGNDADTLPGDPMFKLALDIEHPSVAEVAVIGKPDPERTEIVKAFVVLRQDHQATVALAKELQQHVRSRLSLHAYPREIEFLAELPKTPSGKVQRFVLRQRASPRHAGPSAAAFTQGLPNVARLKNTRLAKRRAIKERITPGLRRVGQRAGRVKYFQIITGLLTSLARISEAMR
jgi:hypothetical protein